MGYKRLNVKLEEELVQFLDKKKTPNTKNSYNVAFKNFTQYLREKYQTFNVVHDLLERAYDDIDKPRRERQYPIEAEFDGFIKYLNGIGKSTSTQLVYIACVKNYFRFRDVPPVMRKVSLPDAQVKKENRKHRWTKEEIRQFIRTANNPRDKAIIVCLFQSGLSLVDLVNLNYRDIKRDFEGKTLPIMLRLIRQKTGEELITFFGRDAVKYLRLYLETRPPLKNGDPLFTKLGTDYKRVTETAIEFQFKEIAKKVDFLDPETLNAKNRFNPCRPHSLRSAFRSWMSGQADRDTIEVWMGHSIGDVQKRYLQLPDEKLREDYKKAEIGVALEKTSNDELIEIKTQQTPVAIIKQNQKLRKEIDALKLELETLTNSVSDYDDLKKRVDRFEAFVRRQIELSREIDRKLEIQHHIDWDEQEQQDRIEWEQYIRKTHTI